MTKADTPACLMRPGTSWRKWIVEEEQLQLRAGRKCVEGPLDRPGFPQDCHDSLPCVIIRLPIYLINLRHSSLRYSFHVHIFSALNSEAPEGRHCVEWISASRLSSSHIHTCFVLFTSLSSQPRYF